MSINLESYSPPHDWHESVYDSAKELGAIIGLDIDDIYFSGFSSQGDGASFTGSYEYKPGAAKAIRAECPTDKELHGIADRLQATQKSFFFKLSASVTQSGRYVHEMTMRADVEDSRDSYRDVGDAGDDLLESFRDFARWIYRMLESEYDYQSAWQIAQGWQDKQTEADESKAEAREIVRASALERPLGPVAFASVRSSIRDALQRWQDALSDRKELAEAFHYYQDGKAVDLETFAAGNL